jgi:hypothetical protein
VITDIEKVLNDLHSNQNKNGGKDIHPMWEVLKDYWEEGQ